MARRRSPAPALLLVAALAAAARAADVPPLAAYREAARAILAEARRDSFAWDRLAELTDTYGHRLSGSPALAAALDWAAEEMRKDGLENVRLEPVTVPHWVRGAESLEIVEPFPGPLVMLGLGGSVATPPEGISAELLVVSSFEELDARQAEAAGRIVLFDVPYTSYGETVRYRAAGASRAALHGARAVLLRSVGPTGLRTPHTGGLRYDDEAPRIPAAAIPAEDANRLRRLRARGRRVVLKLAMEARFLEDAASANLVGEIRGRELPEEVVLVAGHIDSWDTGTGAMDDGGGVVATWDALRVIRKLGLRPRRTLRVVAFTNEENGLRGAAAYRDRHAAELGRHVMALESDGGVFRLQGFAYTGPAAGRAVLEGIAGLLEPLGAGRIGDGGGGADIAPLAQAAAAQGLSLPLVSPIVENTRYFVYHHTPADTVERLDPGELASNVAGIAVLAYVVADLPQRLGR